MSFDAILQTIVDDCGGGLAAALMGSDGVSITEVVATNVSDDQPLSEEIGTAGAEFGRILIDIAKASDSLGGGAVRRRRSFCRNSS